jgi:hypothetical protein
MATSEKNNFERLLRAHLNAARSEREQVRANPLSSADRLAVRTYQQMRMASTHAPLLRSDRYAPAARFFLTELYSTADLAQRDADIERVIRVLVKFLPDKALATLAAALEMDALSERLDNLMAQSARRVQGDQRPLKFTAQNYLAAYADVGEFDAREQQIALTENIGLALDKLSRMPMLLTLLKLMRVPANSAGVGGLQAFLENGYAAFTHMKGGKEFISTIVNSERAEHERLAAAARGIGV